MELQWKAYLEPQGTDDKFAVSSAQRPTDGATPSNFGLSLSEGRQVLAVLQQLVA
jgi:hypothetical protein